MSLYKIADVVVDMTLRFPDSYDWYAPYLISHEEEAQMQISASDKDIDFLVTNGVDITPEIAENMVLCNKFNALLPRYYGSYLHSSALKYEDKVYLFSAASGVGKSTHTKKWIRLFPDKTSIINDDKPSFRIIDGKCYVYGTPFSGGTNIHQNDKGELGAIVFLERSNENRLERMPAYYSVRELMQHTYSRFSPRVRERILTLFDEIITKYPIYKLYCTDSDDAVKTAFEIVK